MIQVINSGLLNLSLSSSEFLIFVFWRGLYSDDPYDDSEITAATSFAGNP